jgi:uncharacterized protein HemX
MAEQETKPESTSPPAAKTAPTRSRGRSISAGLALILAAIAVIASGYLWYALLYQRQELLGTDVIGRLTQLENDNREFRESLSATDATVTELRDTQEVLKSGFEKMQSDFAHSRTEWVLAETERLLLVANHRLQLARDARSALAALRAADQQLNLLANPKYLPIRRDIAREINALEALEKTDIAGMALKIASLAESIDRLPLAADARLAAQPAPAKTAAAETGDWRRNARSLWEDVLSLVRVRSDLQVQKPLLPPEQSYFVRENVRLMLFGAQQALLQGNVTVYRNNLKTATQWVKDYFDVNTQVIANAISELDALYNARIVGELPDISASLEALRRLQAPKGSGP